MDTAAMSAPASMQENREMISKSKMGYRAPHPQGTAFLPDEQFEQYGANQSRYRNKWDCLPISPWPVDDLEQLDALPLPAFQEGFPADYGFQDLHTRGSPRKAPKPPSRFDAHFGEE